MTRILDLPRWLRSGWRSHCIGLMLMMMTTTTVSSCINEDVYIDGLGYIIVMMLLWMMMMMLALHCNVSSFLMDHLPKCREVLVREREVDYVCLQLTPVFLHLIIRDLSSRFYSFTAALPSTITTDSILAWRVTTGLVGQTQGEWFTALIGSYLYCTCWNDPEMEGSLKKLQVQKDVLRSAIYYAYLPLLLVAKNMEYVSVL